MLNNIMENFILCSFSLTHINKGMYVPKLNSRIYITENAVNYYHGHTWNMKKAISAIALLILWFIARTCSESVTTPWS